MKTRRLVAVGLLIAAAIILSLWLFSPVNRTPSSIKISALTRAELSGYVEILFRRDSKKLFILRKKEGVGRVDINKLMQKIPIYSSLLAKSEDINNPKTIAQLNETNNRFLYALEEVAKEENLRAIVREGRRLKDDDYAPKYMKFRDVTDKILAKMEGL